MARADGRILVTGATGYVGGRLLGRLEERGGRVRCLARRPEFLRARVGPGTEVFGGDLLRADSLAEALRDVDVAYYLVHAMGSARSFEEEDRRAAENFAAAARRAGVRRIVYLGGLGDGRDSLSPHLRSRHEVGEILRSGGVGVVEFRASIVLGSGSLSFEMIRTLVERLPVMVTPRWVAVPAQPIAVDDVLGYLLAALELPGNDSRIYEIGGPDRVTYGDLMREYARQRGLRRLILQVPVLTPWLSSLWLGLVTPLYARVGRILVESIRHPTVVRDDAARREFAVRPVGYREAIAAALRHEGRGLAETRWNDSAWVRRGGAEPAGAGGRRLVDERRVEVPLAPAAAFAPVRRIGGATGWYYGNWLWRLRGALDLLCGGIGTRRGRRAPDALRVGDTLDWWRVEAFDPDRLLRLRAEMTLPGRAWLEFAVRPSRGGSEIRQTAVFEPAGRLGYAYWYLLYPVHQLLFRGMLRKIGEAAGAPVGPAGMRRETRHEHGAFVGPIAAAFPGGGRLPVARPAGRVRAADAALAAGGGAGAAGRG